MTEEWNGFSIPFDTRWINSFVTSRFIVGSVTLRRRRESADLSWSWNLKFYFWFRERESVELVKSAEDEGNVMYVSTLSLCLAWMVIRRDTSLLNMTLFDANDNKEQFKLNIFPVYAVYP